MEKVVAKPITPVRWVIGILVTIALAAQGMTMHWVNNNFQTHAERPHVGAVSIMEYTGLRADLQKIEDKVDVLTGHIIRVKTLIENGRGRK